MAAGVLPKPGKVVRGKEIGPCTDQCNHKQCKQTRNMANTKCYICDERIGYETKFYETETGLVHSQCKWKNNK